LINNQQYNYVVFDIIAEDWYLCVCVGDGLNVCVVMCCYKGSSS